MCTFCDELVAETARYLDEMLASECHARERLSELSTQEQTIRLANIAMEGINRAPDKGDAVQQLALAFALSCTRLIAVQQIHGVSFT